MNAQRFEIRIPRLPGEPVRFRDHTTNADYAAFVCQYRAEERSKAGIGVVRFGNGWWTKTGEFIAGFCEVSA